MAMPDVFRFPICYAFQFIVIEKNLDKISPLITINLPKSCSAPLLYYPIGQAANIRTNMGLFSLLLFGPASSQLKTKQT